MELLMRKRKSTDIWEEIWKQPRKKSDKEWPKKNWMTKTKYDLSRVQKSKKK